MPDGAMPSGASTLNRRQKAALLVQVLLSEGEQLDLARLPEDSQLALTRELAGLRQVDKVTRDAVVLEFVEEMEQLGLTGPGGLAAAFATLSDRLSDGARARLTAEMSDKDPWAHLLSLPLDDLMPLMLAESAEVCAITLSKLPVVKAADILSRLPGDRARLITYAMSLTAGVGPVVVARIGAALVQDYTRRATPAFTQPANQRLGAILTSTQSATRDQLLQTLGDDAPDFAAEVRRAIFTFADIPKRLAAPDVPKVIREVEQSELVVALAYGARAGDALAVATHHLLSNLSQRLGDQLREEMDERGPIKPADGESAQNAVVGAIKRLADAGQINLYSVEEDENA